MANNYYFILGAPDLEMALIERLLSATTEAGLTAGFGYAEAEGRRCHAGNAYKATGIALVAGSSYDPDSTTLVVIECDHPGAQVVIDHHRPGDPGFGRPVSEAIQASSLGQLLSLLGREPEYAFAEKFAKVLWTLGFTDIGGSLDPLCELSTPPAPGVIHFGDHYVPGEYLIGAGLDRRGVEDELPPLAALAMVFPAQFVAIMAADHNLAASYTGQIPGVKPEEILAVRLAEVAGRNRVTEDVARQEITKAAGLLAAAPRIVIAGEQVVDIRECGVQPYASEAALTRGLGNFIGRIDTRDATKVLLSATAPVVAAFLANPLPGVSKTYGDPARGFAGGTQAVETTA